MTKKKLLDCVYISGKTPDYFAGTKTYVSTGALDTDHIDFDKTETITYDKRPSRADVQCDKGDVIFAKMYATNKTLLINNKETDYIYSTGFCCLTPKQDIVNSETLYYLLNSPSFISQKDKFSSGSTQKAITNLGLSKIIVGIPDLEEQENLNDTLGKLHLFIDNCEKLLGKYDLLIKSQFVEMFGNPKSSIKKFPMVPITSISKSCFAGGDKTQIFSSKKAGDCIFPVYSNGEENLGLLGFTNSYRVSDEALTISARGSIGFCAIRSPKFTPVVRLITIIPNEKINIIYLKCLIDNMDIKSNGSSQQQLTIPQIKQMRFIYPPIVMQDKFASIIEQIDKSKFRVKQLQEKAETLYKALLQKYFG